MRRSDPRVKVVARAGAIFFDVERFAMNIWCRSSGQEQEVNAKPAPANCSCSSPAVSTSKLTYNSPPAPTVLIVPTNLDVARINVAPPRFELFSWDVERGGRHQVIKDDSVLLAPTEGGE